MNDLNDGTGYLPQISQILIDLKYDEDYQADYQINSLEQVIDFI